MARVLLKTGPSKRSTSMKQRTGYSIKKKRKLQQTGLRIRQTVILRQAEKTAGILLFDVVIVKRCRRFWENDSPSPQSVCTLQKSAFGQASKASLPRQHVESTRRVAAFSMKDQAGLALPTYDVCEGPARNRPSRHLAPPTAPHPAVCGKFAAQVLIKHGVSRACL